MPSRSDYLKSLNRMRSNYQSAGNPLINPADDSTSPGEEISSYAYMETRPANPSVEFQSEGEVAEAKANREAREYAESRNWWQRTWDTVGELSSNLVEGVMELVDGVGDFLIGTAGEVGSWFGGDTQWAEDAIGYDWVAQATNVVNKVNQMQYGLFSGDTYTQDYWDSWGSVGSAEGSRAEINRLHAGSYTSEMGESGQDTYNAITQAIGEVLPGIVVSVATGGAAAPALAMAAAQTISAAGSGTEEALQNGATLRQANQSGLISGAIEAGTELLSFGTGKIFGKISGKAVSWGTRAGGTTFAKEVSKLSAKEIGKAALEEGTEELISELLSPFAAIPYEGSEAFQQYQDPQLYYDSLTSFVAGAVAGGFAHGVHAGVARSRYGVKGEQALNIINDLQELHERGQSEARKGTSASQSRIDAIQERIGQGTKELTSILDSMANSADPKVQENFRNLMNAIKNPEAAVSSFREEAERQGIEIDDGQAEAFRSEYLSDYKSVAEALGQSVYEDLAQQLTNGRVSFRIGTQEEFADSGDRAFLRTGENEVVINPSRTSEFYQLAAHEGISHAVLDEGTESLAEMVRWIESDPTLRAEYHSQDEAIGESYPRDFKTQRSERLAHFIERYVSDAASFDSVKAFQNNKGLRNRMKSALRNASTWLRARLGSKSARVIEQINRAIASTDGKAYRSGTPAQGLSFAVDLSKYGKGEDGKITLSSAQVQEVAKQMVDEKDILTPRIVSAEIDGEEIKVVGYQEVINLDDLDFVSRKEVVKQFLVETFRDAKVTTADGLDVGMTRRSASKVARNSTSHQQEIAIWSGELLQIGKFVGEARDSKGRNFHYRYYDSYVAFGDDVYRAHLNIRSDVNASILYDINKITPVEVSALDGRAFAGVTNTLTNDSDLVKPANTIEAQKANKEGSEYESVSKTLDGSETEGENNVDGRDEFARLQEQGRVNASLPRGERAYAKDNEGLRTRLSESFRRRLGSEDGGPGDGKLLDLESGKGSSFRVIEGVDGNAFRDIFSVARDFTENGELVDVHDSYAGATCYISEDGLSGFAITEDGDLVSVFNASNKKGFLRAIAPIVREKARTLDCYASQKQDLQKIYAKVIGFKTASVMDWNGDYDHDSIGENHGNPNVAFMVNTDADVETWHFGKDEYDAAKAYQTSFVAEEIKHARDLTLRRGADQGDSEAEARARPPELEPRKAEDVKNEALAHNRASFTKAGAESAIREIASELVKSDSSFRLTYNSESAAKASERLFRLFNKGNVTQQEIIEGIDALFSDVAVKTRMGDIRLGNIMGNDAQREIVRKALGSYMKSGELTPAEKARRLLGEVKAQAKAEIRAARERMGLMNEALRQVEKAYDYFRADKRYGREELDATAGLRSIVQSAPFYKQYVRGNLWKSTTISSERASAWAADSARKIAIAQDSGIISEFEGKALTQLLDRIMGNEPDPALVGDYNGDYRPTGKSLSNSQIRAVSDFFRGIKRMTEEKRLAQREALRESANDMAQDAEMRVNAMGSRLGSRLSGMRYDLYRQNDVFSIAMGTEENPVTQRLEKVAAAKIEADRLRMEWTRRYIPEDEQGAWRKMGRAQVEFKGMKLRKADLISLYAPLVDQHTYDLVVDNPNARARLGDRHVTLSSEDVRNLKALLGEETVSRVESYLRSVFADDSDGNVTDAVRDWQVRNYGFSLLERRTDGSVYVPRSMDRSGAKGDVGSSNVSAPKGASVGSNSNLTKARQPQGVVTWRAVFPTDIVRSYIDQAANEVALKKATSDALSMLRLNVETANGSKAKLGNILNELVRDGNARYQDAIASLNGSSIGGSDGLLQTVVGRATQATFMLNVPTMLKNFLSAAKIPMEVGPANALYSLFTGKGFNLARAYRLVRNDPVWWARYADQGFLKAEANIGQGAGQGYASASRSALSAGWEKASNYLMLASYGDKATTLMEVAAHLAAAERANPGKTRPEIEGIALDSWHKWVNRAQSTNEAYGKSRAQLGKFNGKPSSVAKELSRFTSDLSANLTRFIGGLERSINAAKLVRNLQKTIRTSTNQAEIARATKMIEAARASIGTGLKRDVVLGLFSILAAALGEWAIEELIDRLYGKKEWSEDANPLSPENLKALGNTALGNVVPLYNSISYAVENDGSLELYSLSHIDNIISSLSTLGNAIAKAQGGEGGDFAHRWVPVLYQLARTVSPILGIPLNNLQNILVGIPKSMDWDFAFEISDYLYPFSETSVSSKFGSAAKTGNLSRASYYARTLASSFRGQALSADLSSEIARLRIEGYDAMPAKPVASYADPETGAEIVFTDAQEATFGEEYAKAAGVADAMIADEGYSSLDSKDKAKAMSKLFEAYREYAEAKAVKSGEPSNRLAAFLYATNGSEDIAKFVPHLVAIGKIKGNGTASRRDLVLGYVNSLRGLTRSEKLLLLSLAGYAVSEQNRSAMENLIAAMGGSASSARAFAS